MPSRVAELVRSAPDWSTVDPRSPEVTSWLARARQVAEELRPADAGSLRVPLQFIHNDIARHGPEIVEILRRVASMRRNRGT
jgi:phage terminase Nu1 subunit (DNA packaging protein)